MIIVHSIEFLSKSWLDDVAWLLILIKQVFKLQIRASFQGQSKNHQSWLTFIFELTHILQIGYEMHYN